MVLSGSDIIVRTLIEQGCDTVFGYPGGNIIDVYDSLYRYRDEVHHILTAHEQGAAHAADGYARATGRVGVVMATSGPGATNLVTGIATAYLDSIPMVAITGNVPSTQIATDAFQEIDITGITLPITKHNYFVESVDEIADTIREAFEIAISGRPGPVLVDVPKDAQVATGEYEPAKPVAMRPRHPSKDIRIEDAATYINMSDRPYIYFGGGAVASDACPEILELADRIDSPIGCSMMGISAIPSSEPRFLGMEGMHGHYSSSMALKNSDCIIAVGVRFNDRSTGDIERFAQKARIVHIDIDGAELSKTTHDAYSLRGDAKLTLRKLIPLLAPADHGRWMADVERYRDEERAADDERAGLTPRNVLSVLDDHLLPDTPVITDVGQHQMWAAQYLTFENPRCFISSGGLGTMGFGLGAAIGAHVGTGKRTVLVTGDGSFGMNLIELATAVTQNTPVIILIMDNRSLGMVRQWQSLFFDEHYSNTDLDRRTDFVALAKAFGADGVKVGSVEELDMALSTAFDHEGPFVIDCPIGRDELVLPMLPPGGSIDDLITKVGE